MTMLPGPGIYLSGAPAALPGGAWVPWDALVSNNAGVGDYGLLSAACLAEPAGAIIALDPSGTTYTETADIVMKAGQVIWGLDGIDDSGRLDYDMVDQIIDINVDDTIIRGIYFQWSAIATNNDKIDIDGATRGIIENCTFDFSPSLAAHEGLDLNTCSLFTIRDVEILNNPGTVRPIAFDSVTDSKLERIRMTGGDLMTAPLMYIRDSGENIFDDIDISSPDTATGIWHIHEDDIVGTTGPNIWTNIKLNGDNQTDGIRLENDETQMSNLYSSNTQLGVDLAGDRQRLSDFTLETIIGSDGVLAEGNDGNIVNGIINSTFADGIDSSGDRNNFCNITTNSGGGGSDVNNTGDYNTFVNVKTTAGTFENNGSTHTTYISCVASIMNNVGAATNDTQTFGCQWAAVNDTGDTLQQGMAVHVPNPAANPTVNDDVNEGYLVGISYWYNSATLVLYRCDGNGAGAAVWTPVNAVAGVSPWTALVHPSGLGDYDEINLACTGEAAGAIIAVAPGTYTESGNIVPKEGQRIVAWGGAEINGATPSVQADLGTNIIDINVDEVEFEGLYFTVTAAAPGDDKAYIDVGGDYTVFQDCTFDFTASTAQHRGIRFDAGGVSFCRFENVNILGDVLAYRMISGNGTVDAFEGPVTDSIFRNIYITGCMTTVNAGEQAIIDIEDPERNVWDTLRHDHRGLTSAQAGAMLRISMTGAGEGCSYSNIFLANDALAADGNGIQYSGAFRKPDTLQSIHLQGFYVAMQLTCPHGSKLSDFTIEGCGDKSIDTGSCESLSISNGYIRASGTTGLEVTAVDSVFNNIVFDNTAGTYDIRVLATANDNKFSNMYGDKTMQFNPGTGSAISNFKCTTLDINADETYAENGEITGNMTVDGDDCRFSNLFVDGTCTIGDGITGCSFVGCRIDTMAVSGADYTMFSSCYMDDVTVGAPGTTSLNTMFAGCRCTDLTTTGDADETIISGCLIDGTLTNGGIKTSISSTEIGTFTDNGDDTIRDVYTQETLGGAGPFSIRGSRDYDNTGLGAGSTITLPDPAAVQVTVGYRFRVVIAVAQLITIAQPALQQIHINGSSSTAGAGGNVNSNTQWSILELEYKGNNNWVAVASLGTWNLV